MQTYLPYRSFIKSAQSLDDRTLGRQRVDALSIMECLFGCKLKKSILHRSGVFQPTWFDEDGYYVHENDMVEGRNYVLKREELMEEEQLPKSSWTLEPLSVPNIAHPAIDMWRGYDWALLRYGRAIIDEWLLRDYIDTVWDELHELYIRCSKHQLPNRMPAWVRDENVHTAYQSLLIRKDSSYYERQFPGVPNNLPFIWPTS